MPAPRHDVVTRRSVADELAQEVSADHAANVVLAGGTNVLGNRYWRWPKAAPVNSHEAGDDEFNGSYRCRCPIDLSVGAVHWASRELKRLG